MEASYVSCAQTEIFLVLRNLLSRPTTPRPVSILLDSSNKVTWSGMPSSTTQSHKDFIMPSDLPKNVVTIRKLWQCPWCQASRTWFNQLHTSRRKESMTRLFLCTWEEATRKRQSHLPSLITFLLMTSLQPHKKMMMLRPWNKVFSSCSRTSNTRKQLK